MPRTITTILNIFINGVKEILGDHLEKIILYGSYARGDFNNESDIDIMVLTNLTDNEIIEYRKIISDFTFDIELENNISISPLIKNIDKFNKRIDIVPFYMNVMNEGVLLNG